MKKILQSALFAFTLFSLLAFAYATKSEIAGTYTVGDTNPSSIKLVLNSDFTFTYTDYSNPQKKVNTHGKWESKNNHVQLKDFESTYTFHTKWKIGKDGNVARARKGMAFYTLRKL